jgi:hypothetical protein
LQNITLLTLQSASSFLGALVPVVFTWLSEVNAPRPITTVQALFEAVEKFTC